MAWRWWIPDFFSRDTLKNLQEETNDEKDGVAPDQYLEYVPFPASLLSYENLMKLKKNRDLREEDSRHIHYLLNIYQLPVVLFSKELDLDYRIYLCELRTGRWTHIPFMKANPIIEKTKRKSDYRYKTELVALSVHSAEQNRCLIPMLTNICLDQFISIANETS